MGWLLRHNWLWTLLAFALGAVITWFLLVRRSQGPVRVAGREAPAWAEVPEPVRHREPVLVGAAGRSDASGDASDTESDAVRDAVRDRSDDASGAGTPGPAAHEPLHSENGAMHSDQEPARTEQPAAADNREPVRAQADGDRRQESMHAGREPAEADPDQPGTSDQPSTSGQAERGPVVTDPAPGRPTQGAQFEPEPTRSEAVEPEPTHPEPVEPEAVKPEPVRQKAVKPEPTQPEPTQLEPVESGPVETGPVETGPVEPKPVELKATQPEPVEPVSPVPAVDPAPAFSERMENDPAYPEELLSAATAVPVNGTLVDGVPLNAVLAQPEGAEEVKPGRYGEGSADAQPHQSAPDGYTIKGNEQSMVFHTPDSPSYGRTRPQVWFRTEADAERAGFTRYVRQPAKAPKPVD